MNYLAIAGMLALQSASVQAGDVKIICDIRGTDNEGRDMATTRTFLLNDATKTFLAVGEIGASNPCEGKCEISYTADVISFSRPVGAGQSNFIRFSLNRLSGRMRETWALPGLNWHRVLEGTCEVAAPGKRKF